MEAWIDEDDERRSAAEEAEEAWAAADADPRPRDVDAAWTSFQERVREEQGDAEPKTGREDRRARRGRRRRSRGWVPAGIVAACLLVVAGAAFFFATESEEAPTPEPRIISASPGERTRAQLSDGSVVRLNADSRLIVAPNFGEDRRRVRLEGEAYFDVEPGRPFTVEARDSRVRVLGTAFGVRSYASDEQVSVVVAEGRVGVSSERDTAAQTLSPRQRAVVGPRGDIRVDADVNLTQYLGWREGRLVFRSTPLRDVMREIERQYGLRAWLLDDELADRQLTARFDDAPLDEVLEITALSLEVGYRRTDSTVIFGRPGRENLTAPAQRPQSH